MSNIPELVMPTEKLLKVRGNFEWEDSLKQKVKFVENPDGVFTAVKIK